MTDKNKIYGKRVTEIAEYLYANPLASRGNILAKFGKKWQTSVRTVDRIIKDAKKHNEARQIKREKAKDEVLIRSAREMAENAEKTRNELTGILLEIARGKSVRKIQNELIIPTESDRIRAIAELNKMTGNYAPVLTAQTDSRGNDVIDTVNVNIRKQ
ncbi:MAG: hypothetical protein LBK94_05990 [Prevotellaceae bacterium]|jgi:hypothetical protein|nr:hypothetical protein [Prevotellaceae bacterium]